VKPWKFLRQLERHTEVCDAEDATHVRIDIARKMQASGKKWREKYHATLDNYLRSRREVVRLREENVRLRQACNNLIAHGQVMMSQASRVKAAIYNYEADLKQDEYIDAEAREAALDKLMEVVE